MGEVLLGFSTLAIIVAAGYILTRKAVVGGRAAEDLSRVVFAAGTPALMFYNVADAPVAEVFSPGAAATVLTSAILALIYILIARFGLRKPGGETIIGALSSSYVNAGNLGIPILIFAVGNAAAIAPVLLWQLLIMVPVSFTALDRITNRGDTGVVARIVGPLLAPPVLGVIAGILVSLTDVTVPTLIARPIEMLAEMAVPAMLLAFGMSLHRADDSPRAPFGAAAWIALAMKSFVAPLLGAGLGLAFGLNGTDLLGVVVVASLPTAQNIFVYAMRYQVGVALSQNLIVWTTVLCVPVILAAVGIFS